jgi:hypothetical protein
MKRISLAAVVTASSLVLAPVGIAHAHGATTAKVKVQPTAQFDDAGFVTHVGLVATCTGGSEMLYGFGEVQLTQSYPETANPVTAHGSGANNAVCDGNPHTVAVTTVGVRFDAGKAWAEAVLKSPAGVTVATDQRWITITVQGG